MTWGPYHVQVWRESNGSWSAAARDLDGAFTPGDSLAQIDRGMREAIAVTLDLPRGAENEIDLRTDISIDGGELDELAAHARQSRTAAEAATSAAERAAVALRQRGLSVRDVAG